LLVAPVGLVMVMHCGMGAGSVVAAVALTMGCIQGAAESPFAGIGLALAGDDQCSTADSPCAVNALQRRGQAESLNSACHITSNNYTLDWEAKGRTFFRDWTFVTEDEVHGAHHFADRSEADQHNVVAALDTSAILRVGGRRAPSYEGEAWKRYAVNIHTNMAWNPSHGFLAVMKYQHVPYGCGIWPGFWAMNSDKVWPGAGELDILEYANEAKSKVSFHINSASCELDSDRAEVCKPQGSGEAGAADCATNYFLNKFGCRPPQRQLRGEEFAGSPGVIATEWTANQITVYYIPESEIPDDLSDGRPVPSTWSRWVMAHLPFKRPCADIGPQELVLNVQLCGDWAGGAWEESLCHLNSGYSSKGGSCHAGLSEPSDCCTQFVTSAAQGAYMHQYAFFEINYIKVFTANGAGHTASGTFRRGGEMLHTSV
jgi:hypothetical protein